MDCIIIEDGIRAQKHLENQLALTGYDVNIKKRIDSVEMAVSWLKNNSADLIFLDIQLGDGLSFEIFDHVEVNTPVIFTTSYDQYITRAFDVNSISYLLKPVEVESLKSALDKYNRLHGAEPQPINDSVIQIRQEYQKRFIVQKGSIIKSIRTEDVAYLYIQSKGLLILITKYNEQYLVENTLERLEHRLDPDKFFRINRQYILNIDAINIMTPYDDARIKIETNPPCKEELLVSFKRVRNFREWLDR
jgi:two-component system response regulator LytT